MHAAGSMFDYEATSAVTLEITVAESPSCLSTLLVSLLYLNGLPLIVFILGSFLGADHFHLPLIMTEPEGFDIEDFLEGHSSALWPFPPQFQQVEFTTKPDS